MTANQIAYAKHLEEKRANQEKEYLNRETLGETRVHNRETELIEREKLAETNRHNVVGEVETNRANLAKETETNRANVAKEIETKRANVAKETETHRANVVKEVETRRHNVAAEGNEASKITKDYIVGLTGTTVKGGTDILKVLAGSGLLVGGGAALTKALSTKAGMAAMSKVAGETAIPLTGSEYLGIAPILIPESSLRAATNPAFKVQVAPTQ
nr:MAG: hypothetical protein [Picobirnavirus sp.]